MKAAKNKTKVDNMQFTELSMDEEMHVNGGGYGKGYWGGYSSYSSYHCYPAYNSYYPPQPAPPPKPSYPKYPTTYSYYPKRHC